MFCDLRMSFGLAYCICLRREFATYGEDELLFLGDSLADSSWVGFRAGEEFTGGGANVGQFLGLGSRLVCGEASEAAGAEATAVDMAGSSEIVDADISSVRISGSFCSFFLLLVPKSGRPPEASRAIMRQAWTGGDDRP